MSYFFLPQIHTLIDISNIKISTNNDYKIILSKSLCFFLTTLVSVSKQLSFSKQIPYQFLRNMHVSS